MKNNRTDPTEKCGKNRVQYFEERIEDVVAVKIRSIQTKAEQQEQNEKTKEVSNSQLQKETLIGDGRGKEKVEEPKYRNRSVEVKRTKQPNYNERKLLFREGTAEQ